jgi:hypothetical protein
MKKQAELLRQREAARKNPVLEQQQQKPITEDDREKEETDVQEIRYDLQNKDWPKNRVDDCLYYRDQKVWFFIAEYLSGRFLRQKLDDELFELIRRVQRNYCYRVYQAGNRTQEPPNFEQIHRDVMRHMCYLYIEKFVDAESLFDSVVNLWPEEYNLYVRAWNLNTRMDHRQAMQLARISKRHTKMRHNEYNTKSKLDCCCICQSVIKPQTLSCSGTNPLRDVWSSESAKRTAAVLLY